MSAKSKRRERERTVRISSGVLRRIRQHARSNSKTEVCGVLIGRDEDGATSIEACIAGVNAAQGGAHVTFTQDTWEHIYKIKDRDFPDDRIVGWYHSHPGFGVFLSDHDTFIHKNFFSAEPQVAWVYDPHSDEEGCFGWVGQRLERLANFSICDDKGGEGAGETGKPEPTVAEVEQAGEREVERAVPGAERNSKPPSWLEMAATALTYISVFLLGAVMAWYLFPRVAVVPVPVDPYTGRPLQMVPRDPAAANSSQSTKPEASPGSAGKPGTQNTPASTKRGDVQR